MDVSAETADLVVKESLQATESAAKLLGSGVKNVAALLLAIAKDNYKVVGKTNSKRLARDPAPAEVIRIKKEDMGQFQKLAKEFGVLFFFAQKKGNKSGYVNVVSTQNYAAQLNAVMEAMGYALAAELITEGSLNVFAHPGNVDMNNRLTVLDLYEMGEQLRPTALVVTLEAIQNRVMENRKKGKYTWVFIDEAYLFFKFYYSGEFLYRAWKRFRKYAGIMTAATQNVEECLRSETARLMLANSEFLLLFNQAATDRAELAKLLHISDTQLGYITNAEPGHGLLRIGGSLVPFSNTIPRDTELYRLLSTTPGEK